MQEVLWAVWLFIVLSGYSPTCTKTLNGHLTCKIWKSFARSLALNLPPQSVCSMFSTYMYSTRVRSGDTGHAGLTSNFLKTSSCVFTTPNAAQESVFTPICRRLCRESSLVSCELVARSVFFLQNTGMSNSKFWTLDNPTHPVGILIVVISLANCLRLNGSDSTKKYIG